MINKIPEIQKRLCMQGVDGWLLFDHHGSNKFVRELLRIPSETLLTRRFFYWIPREGSPCKILHRIEEEAIEHVPGQKCLYLSWKELEHTLATTLRTAKKIAMEYSPRNANPYVSMVDAGTVELIREQGIEVVSSAELLQ